MKIKILENSLINKIAAGEVIERPANVIKELLENSLDAQATEIKIEIEKAGLNLIKISDNGIGMEREDLLLSCKRHATSKIENEQDLNAINSLGFRGEALASIAEVSHLKIKTKTKDNEVGNLLEIEGGILLGDQKIGCSNGTIIEIYNLFYNVPARKKFLKSPEVELAHIIDIITRYAIINKNIAINLIHNNKEILNSPITENQLNNIISIYGTETAKNLIEINHKTNHLKIEGHISKPNLTRASKSDQSLYINGRYVRSQVINNAIYSAYKTLLFTNRHPVYILNLIINPADIDINIHPSKLDVRLKDEQEVCETFFLGIKQALQDQILIPTTTLENETRRKPTQTYETQKDIQSNLFISPPPKQYKIENTTNKIKDTLQNQELKQNKTTEQKENPFQHFHIIGQANKTYIIAETKEGIIIIDQHAAEERVNYETFLKNHKNKTIPKQQFLQPKIIELTPNQHQITLSNKKLIEKLGFDFENFGQNSIKLVSIPEIFGKLKSTIFIDIINELSKVNSSIIETEIEEKIIRFACRASVKAGDELTLTQMQELIIKLGTTDNPYSCPHGRPTIIRLTTADLEKKFKRTGW